MIPAELADWVDDSIHLPERHSIHLLVQFVEVLTDLFVIIRAVFKTTFVKGENYLLFSYFHGMGYELQSVRFMGAVVNHVNTTKIKSLSRRPGPCILQSPGPIL